MLHTENPNVHGARLMLYSHCSSVIQSSTAHGNNPGVLYLPLRYGADIIPQYMCLEHHKEPYDTALVDLQMRYVAASLIMDNPHAFLPLCFGAINAIHPSCP